MGDDIQNNEYSERLNSVLNRKGHWLTRYGISILFIISLSVILLSSYIQLPDFNPAYIKVMSYGSNYTFDQNHNGDMVCIRFISERDVEKQFHIGQVILMNKIDCKGEIVSSTTKSKENGNLYVLKVLNRNPKMPVPIGVTMKVSVIVGHSSFFSKLFKSITKPFRD